MLAAGLSTWETRLLAEVSTLPVCAAFSETPALIPSWLKGFPAGCVEAGVMVICVFGLASSGILLVPGVACCGVAGLELDEEEDPNFSSRRSRICVRGMVSIGVMRDVGPGALSTATDLLLGLLVRGVRSVGDGRLLLFWIHIARSEDVL